MFGRFLAGLVLALTFAASPALAWLHPGAAAPPAYIPFAVHFDNKLTIMDTAGTAPATAGGTLTNLTQFTQGFWLKPRLCQKSASFGSTRSDSTCDGNLFGAIMQAADNSENVPGINMIWDVSGTNATFRNAVGDSLASNATGLAHMCNFTSSVNDWTDNNWHYYWLVTNVGASGTAQVSAAYKDGVLFASGCNYPPSGPMAIAIQLRGWQMHFNPLAGSNPLNDFASAMDVADYFEDTTIGAICPSTAGMTINSQTFTCSVAGALPVASGAGPITIGHTILDAFYKAGPVNPGANCSTPFGRVPEWCYHDTSKATWGTNKGTVNNVTNVSGIYAAPTNPVTSLTRPYVAWTTSVGYTSNSSFFTSTVGTFFTNKTPYGANDILIFKFANSDNCSTCTDWNPQCPSVGTWTQIQRTTPTDVPAYSSVTCWARGATSGMDANGLNTFTYAGGIAPGRNAFWLLIDVAGTGAGSVLDGTPTTSFVGTTTSYVAPSITTTAANDTLLNVYGSYFYSFNGIDSRQDKLGTIGNVGVGDITVTQELLSSAGATGTRTATLPTAIPGDTLTIAITP